MKNFRLTEKEMNTLAERIPTPFLVASTDKVAENYQFMREHLPRAGVFYAIKANPTPAILKRLAKLGAHFDVASAGEMETLHGLGVDGSRMIYANPVKDERGLTAAVACGVRRFTFDDESEIAKMAQKVPGADVLVRIQVRNNKALIDLNTKFGVPPENAIGLLNKAKEAGLNPAGICFHVGSQSLSTAAYEEALLVARKLFDEAEMQGMHLTDLDIGGGFPVPDAKGLSVDLAAMMENINRQIDRLFPATAVWCEPGRYMCGTAVNLVTSVIGTKKRGETPWYILDEGIYGCFSGIIYDHWTYPLHCFGKGSKKPSTFGGPSCDGIDVLYREFMAPDLKIGDKVLVTEMGAYTTVSATRFNGFLIAPTIIFEDQPEYKKRQVQMTGADNSCVKEAAI
ncbi:MAG: type III PLP-dependent enzyme [Selenomonas sp.]|nr:type III PLP-dependent enzyme [Selenomonadales bacterium]MDD7762491.1 type III PLP-dependent enzyme [Selenomonadales bacterium]MDY5716403.1 type III PLP-dependent enzyme [Selenomonas sp.]